MADVLVTLTPRWPLSPSLDPWADQAELTIQPVAQGRTASLQG